jgi:hypothetical protein
MWPCKNISHIQVLVYLSFRTPPIKLKLGLQTDGETTNLTLFIRLFQGSRPGLWNLCMFPGSQHSCSGFIGFCYNTISNRRFRVQGHILSVGGNALKVSQAGLSMWSITRKLDEEKSNLWVSLRKIVLAEHNNVHRFVGERLVKGVAKLYSCTKHSVINLILIGAPSF